MPNKLKELIENGVLDASDVLENIFANYFNVDEANECAEWIIDEYAF